jgi:hypothetical protein
MLRRTPLLIFVATALALSLVGWSQAGDHEPLQKDEQEVTLSVQGFVSATAGTFVLEANGPPAGTGLIAFDWTSLTAGTGGKFNFPVAFDMTGHWEQSFNLFAIGEFPDFEIVFELVETVDASGTPTAREQSVVAATWALRMEVNPAGGPGLWETSRLVPLYGESGPLVKVTLAGMPDPSPFDSPGGSYCEFVSGPTWTLEGALPVN